MPVNNAAICRLAFYINLDPNKNAPRSLSGDPPYTFNISRLEPKINKDADTWNTHPIVTDYYATFELTQAGAVKTVYSKWFECPKGNVAQFLMQPASDRAFGYYWFELDYPAAQGGTHGVVLEMYT